MNFWYLPDDLKPGPELQEPVHDLSVSIPLAKCRAIYNSLLTRLHAHGKRLTCTYCQNEAQTYCSTHRQRLCGDIDCFRKHRWSDKDQCVFVEPSRPLRGWEQHLLATLVALAVGLLVVSVVAL